MTFCFYLSLDRLYTDHCISRAAYARCTRGAVKLFCACAYRRDGNEARESAMAVMSFRVIVELRPSYLKVQHRVTLSEGSSGHAP